MTKNGRPPSVVAGVEHLGDVRVVHHRQGLPLRLEAGQHRPRVHPRLDDLDRDGPLHRLGLLGHEDAAHAAFADLLDQLVLAREDDADPSGPIAVIFRFARPFAAPTTARCGSRRRCGIVGPQQSLDPAAQLGVAAALAFQVGGTLRRIGEVRRGQE